MKKLIIVSIFLLFITSVFPQGKGLLTQMPLGEFSLFGGVGPNKLSGDIGGDNFKSLFQNDMGYGLSLGARYTFKYNIALRVFGDYSGYRGKDKVEYNTYGAVRKLEFQSKVTGLGGQLEVVLFGNPLAKDPIPHSVYLLAGLKTTKVDATLINPENNANGPEETKNPLTHFLGIGYQYRFSNQFSFGVEAKQNYFHSDRVDGYNPVIRANKHRDEAFDLKLTAAYYFPFSRRMSEFNNRWDRGQRR